MILTSFYCYQLLMNLILYLTNYRNRWYVVKMRRTYCLNYLQSVILKVLMALQTQLALPNPYWQHYGLFDVKIITISLYSCVVWTCSYKSNRSLSCCVPFVQFHGYKGTQCRCGFSEILSGICDSVNPKERVEPRGGPGKKGDLTLGFGLLTVQAPYTIRVLCTYAAYHPPPTQPLISLRLSLPIRCGVLSTSLTTCRTLQLCSVQCWAIK